MFKVTKIAYSDNLTQSKYDQLTSIAKEAGTIRADIWRRYGSVNGVGKGYFDILKEHKQLRVDTLPYKLYEQTLKDTVGDINASMAAAKEKVKIAIWGRYPSSKPCKRKNCKCDNCQERKRLFTLLKADKWLSDSYLRRLMRKHYKHGVTRVDNQIILAPNMYKVFKIEEQGNTWIKVAGREHGKRIAVPLNTTHEPSTTLRLILRNSRVEVHYFAEMDKQRPSGVDTIGIDKGYTEVYIDSDGDIHGDGMGEILTDESDRKKVKNQRRNSIRSISKNTSSKRKAQNINKYNLGTKKRTKHNKRHKARVKDKIYKATHSVVDKASVVIAEDLTTPIKNKKSFGKNQNRRLNGWTKGVMADALKSVTENRGAVLKHVSCSYTSQLDYRYGVLLGTRNGDQFTGFDGEVFDADKNAAINIRDRLTDTEIGLYTPYQKVKSILLERTELFKQTDVYKNGLVGTDPRLKLQTSEKVTSTESELT